MLVKKILILVVFFLYSINGTIASSRNLLSEFLNIPKSRLARLYSDSRKSFSTMDLEEKNIPRHVAVIWDGNRRWAQERGLTSSEGHDFGITKVAPKILENMFDLKIHTATLWLFATSNWNRDKYQVLKLMEIQERFLENITNFCQEKEVKIIHLGRKDRIPYSFSEKIYSLENITKNFDKHVFNLAVDYDGRDEILRALKKIQNKNKSEDLTEEKFANFLDTRNQTYGDPDLIIRTSGEQRLSGFMLWQAKNSEFYFLDKYAPDLNREDLIKAIKDFSERKRRFGN